MPVQTQPCTILLLWLSLLVIVDDLLVKELEPKLSKYSKPFFEGIVKKPVLPVKFSEFTMPESLIGISLFESSIVPIRIPLLAASISPIRSFVSRPDNEILELSSSNSILVIESEVAELVRNISGALLTINSSSSPSIFKTSGSSPRITKLTSEKTGGPEV